MSEPGTDSVKPTSTLSAGALLRAARQAQGLHIAALAASIKVSQRKLELLIDCRSCRMPPSRARSLRPFAAV